MSDFESELAKTPLRGAPADWRREILRAARAAASKPRAEAWWRRLLAPQPVALAAAWVIIVVLQAATPKEPSMPRMTNLAQVIAEIRAQQQLIAELLRTAAPAPAQPHREGATVSRRKHQPA